MLDPLTAIGLCGNIVQFVDFCSKVVSKAHRIYRSADGSLTENLDAETISRDLLYLTAKVEAGLRPSPTQEDQALQDLCDGCNDVAQELLIVLGKLKSERKSGKWRSFKQALKYVWSKDRINTLQTRLAMFREELDLHILVDLSKKLDLDAVAKSKDYSMLETSTQNVIDAVINNRSAFTFAIQEQTAEIRSNIKEQHGKTRAQIANAASSLNDRNNHQHERTREELARMTMEAGVLRREMEQQLAEIKSLITATGQAQEEKQQMDLEAEANAVASSWIAKDLAYTEIMGVITGAHSTADTKFKEHLSLSKREASIKGKYSNPNGRGNEELSQNQGRGYILEPSGSRKQTESWVELDSSPKNAAEYDASRADITHYSSNSRTKERYERLEYINKFRGMGFFRDPDDLPKSLRIAVTNRFTHQQVEDIYADLRLAFSSTRPFFFIGSYMFPATIRLKTSGTRLRSIAQNMTPAILRGYNRHAVFGVDWPALAPSLRETDSVRGMAVFGLHDSQRKGIHSFQGGMFDLKKDIVEIELSDGSSMKLEASMYVWNRDNRHLVPMEYGAWSPEDFLESEFYQDITEPIRVEEAALERS